MKLTLQRLAVFVNTNAFELASLALAGPLLAVVLIAWAGAGA